MTQAARGPCAALLALTVGGLGGPVPAQDGWTGSSARAAITHGAASSMAAHYARLEATLLTEGRLRDDPAPTDAPWDAGTLAHDLVRVAMTSEHYLRGGRFAAAPTPGVLRRWVEPVRVGLRFGASVPAAQRRADAALTAAYADRPGHVTGHPVAAVRERPNVLVLVVGEAERRGLGAFLARAAPGLSRAARRAILRMPPETLCLVVARSHPDPTRGNQSAVVVARAELPPRLRRACLEEELAEAMGLPGDSFEARPSLFNDDEEFGVLTRHDEALLAMLYDPRLRPGMTPAQAAPLLPAVARDAARR